MKILIIDNGLSGFESLKMSLGLILTREKPVSVELIKAQNPILPEISKHIRSSVRPSKVVFRSCVHTRARRLRFSSKR